MKYFSAALITLFLVFTSCTTEPGPYMSIAGFTQGTSYHITYQNPTADSVDLTGEVDAFLAEFDQSMSTYIDTSNISLINRNIHDKADAHLEIVYAEARRVYEVSDGSFDITVGPLIDAWGFGPGRKQSMSQEVIDSILPFVGMDKVQLVDGHVKKDIAGLRLDLNAIAQGYSVDVVSAFLEDKGIINYMVEIGGEIRTKGVSHRGIAWMIGIDQPIFGNQVVGRSLQAVVNLSDKSLASSGNYRKFYEVDGKKIVHTIDPKTGYSKMSQLLSVTIVCDECITADALATACMAKGLEDGKTFIEAQEGVEAMFIYGDDDGIYFEWMTEGMKEMIRE